MMTSQIATIIEDFEFLEDWEDKYRYVIELGKALPEFNEAARTPQNKINGCVSQVWLESSIVDHTEKKIQFVGDSDAHIVRGLVAIMIAAMSCKPATEIVQFDAEALMTKLGLDSHLTPQRSNGLRAMVDRMKLEATNVLENH